MKKIAELISHRYKLIISATIILTLAMGFFALKIKINPDILDYLPKTDKVVQDFNRVGAEYGGSLTGFIVFEDEDIFSRESLKKTDAITKMLQDFEGVNIVTSLTNVMDIKSKEGDVEIAPLFENDSLMSDTSYIKITRDYVMNERIYRGKIIAEDMKKSLIVFTIADDIDQTVLSRQIKVKLQSMNLKNQMYFGGTPFLMLEINSLIIKDLLKLIVPCIFLMILVLFLSFRTLEGVVIPLLNVFVSVVWTAGIMALLHVDVTIISNIIPVVLLAVGSAYSIHMISKFYEEEKIQSDNKKAMTASIEEVALPIFLAAVTTLIGFLSFVFGSYLIMIRDFGIFTAVGVAISFILSITLTPALLLAFKVKDSDNYVKREPKMFARVTNIFIKRRTPLLIVVAFFVVLSIIMIPKITRSADIMDYFKKGSPIRESDKIIEENFGGSARIQIICSGDITKVSALNDMWELERFLEDSAGVRNISSIVDVIKRMNFVIDGKYELPDSDEKLANLYFLTDGEPFIERMLKSDKSEALIEGSLESAMKIDKVTKFINNVEEKLKSSSGDVSYSLTGMPSVSIRLDNSILKSTFFSIILSIILVFILLSIMFRSVRLSLKGTLPIFFTVIMIFGVMSLFKLPLDIATTLVGSVSIGIGIDYSIHYIIRLKKERESGKKYKDAVIATMNTTGRAIITNVLTVAAGFSVLILSDLQPLSHFGLLITMTMLLAGFTAIVMLSVSSKEKTEEK